MRLVSVLTGRNFSPARKVLSITEPSSCRRSLVRTKAPPLPGLTCWNSMIRKIFPSTSMWEPFLNWLVLITAPEATGTDPRRAHAVELPPMSPEVIVLALANAVRPTAFAAVYALLSAPRPRRPLFAFTASGFAFSAALGILIVSALHGVRVETGQSTVYSLVALAGGVAALGLRGRDGRRADALPRPDSPAAIASRRPASGS